MKSRKELVEILARELWDRDDLTSMEIAEIILHAIEQNNAIVVPVNPTESMVERGREELSRGERVQTHARVMWVYEAMLNASPFKAGDPT